MSIGSVMRRLAIRSGRNRSAGPHHRRRRILSGTRPVAGVRWMVLGSPAFVMVVKITDFANLDHLAFHRSLDSSGIRSVFAE